jgi:hypothetical protein
VAVALTSWLATGSTSERPGVAKIAFDEIDVGRDRGQVLALARIEVVEDADPISPRHQRAHQGRPDETGAARHQTR